MTKRSETLKRKWKEGIFKGNTGHIHTDKTKEKMSLDRTKEKNPFYGKHHTEEAKEKIRKAHTNKSFSDETREKLRINTINRWKSGELCNRKECKTNSYVSSWENKYYNTLLTVFDVGQIKRQYRLKGSKHPFDFAIPQLKLLIEIDGNYFHSLPDNIMRDNKVNDFVKCEYGDWNLIRLCDSDLKTMGVI